MVTTTIIVMLTMNIIFILRRKWS